jgi:uncharacterized coiled-coil protein SlyX
VADPTPETKLAVQEEKINRMSQDITEIKALLKNHSSHTEKRFDALEAKIQHIESRGIGWKDPKLFLLAIAIFTGGGASNALLVESGVFSPGVPQPVHEVTPKAPPGKAVTPDPES